MIYMDNAATTRLDKKVLEAMLPYLKEDFGNPSGVYGMSIRAKEAVEEARVRIAKEINAKKSEIYFTSGGSESDNWAIINEAKRKRKGHIIVSAIEHHAILDTVMSLKSEGFEVSLLPVNREGIVRVDILESLIRRDTFLICVMLVNNEVGTIQPIKQITSIADQYGIEVFCDAVAAMAHINIDTKALGVKYLSASAHKFNGPKGVGLLYVRDGDIDKLINGGNQESGKRAGTENVAGIVGMACAYERSKEQLKDKEKIRKIRDYLLSETVGRIDRCSVNGSLNDRVNTNLNLCFEGVDGGTLAYLLGREGICVSTGSACTFGDRKPSFVLRAMGLEENLARSSIRLTFGTDNTMEEAIIVASSINNNVNMLRNVVDE